MERETTASKSDLYKVLLNRFDHAIFYARSEQGIAKDRELMATAREALCEFAAAFGLDLPIDELPVCDGNTTERHICTALREVEVCFCALDLGLTLLAWMALGQAHWTVKMINPEVLDVTP